MSNALGELFGSIADAIREKTGDTAKMKPVDFPEKITAIEAGGGSSADVRYVTFKSEDGSQEYGRIPVAVGYDCPNPKFAVTKASTAQYNYTLAGWATTPNGGLDSNALKAVNEDRILYANFASVLRSYTISFYDDGTLLTTRTVAYGSVPSYEPSKNGYDFVRWEPEMAAVTGSASYTAVWKVKAMFGTATWAEISAITTAKESASTFAVGDRRSDVLTYSNGTTEEIEWVIAKIRDDGSIVLALNHALATLQPMGTSLTNGANYFNNDLGKYITNTVVPALSDELAAVIRPATVGFTSGKILRLPTTKNLGGTQGTSGYSVADTEVLPLFDTDQKRIRTRKADGVAVAYWTGSHTEFSSTQFRFCRVTESGVITAPTDANNGIKNNYGVVLLVDV